MVKKNDFLYLTEQHQGFAFFTNRNKLACAFTFNWDEKRKKYRIADLVNYRSYKSNITDILKISLNGICLNDILQYGYIIRNDRNSQIEKNIVKKYVKTDYQDRCLYLLSHKTKCQLFADFFCPSYKFEKFKEENIFPVKNNDYELMEERLISKGLLEKEGYLIIGYVAFCDFYKGKIKELFAYLRDYREDEFGILYCNEKLSIVRADYETDKQRLYWLEIKN